MKFTLTSNNASRNIANALMSIATVPAQIALANKQAEIAGINSGYQNRAFASQAGLYDAQGAGLRQQQRFLQQAADAGKDWEQVAKMAALAGNNAFYDKRLEQIAPGVNRNRATGEVFASGPLGQAALQGLTSLYSGEGPNGEPADQRQINNILADRGRTPVHPYLMSADATTVFNPDTGIVMPGDPQARAQKAAAAAQAIETSKAAIEAQQQRNQIAQKQAVLRSRMGAGRGVRGRGSGASAKSGGMLLVKSNDYPQNWKYGTKKEKFLQAARARGFTDGRIPKGYLDYYIANGGRDPGGDWQSAAPAAAPTASPAPAAKPTPAKGNPRVRAAVATPPAGGETENLYGSLPLEARVAMAAAQKRGDKDEMERIANRYAIYVPAVSAGDL